MNENSEGFWSAIPEKAHHPIREPMLDAMLWIGEPLSAIDLVDVLDGTLTMWEAAHHLQALEELAVVEPIAGSLPDKKNESGFDVPYGLKAGHKGMADGRARK